MMKGVEGSASASASLMARSTTTTYSSNAIIQEGGEGEGWTACDEENGHIIFLNGEIDRHPYPYTAAFISIGILMTMVVIIMTACSDA